MKNKGKYLQKPFLTGIRVIVLSVLLQLLGVLSVYAAPDRGEPWSQRVSNSIVQVYTETREPYYLNPWVAFPKQHVVGAGFIIEGKKILTSAHVIANHTYIEVRKSLHSRKYKARVLYAAHDSDLALLSVDDDSFFSGVVPVELGKLPAIQEKVKIYGFPEGETLTITDGILTRVEHRTYSHSSRHLLAGEILSDISTGHSGGPVMYQNKAVGVMMQANKSGSVAHMVPVSVIGHFLSDIADGHYDGFPDLGLVTRNLNTSHEKSRYRNSKGPGGVIVDHVIAGSPAEGKIVKGDRVLSVNGHNVDDNGTIEFRSDERTDYHYLVEMKQLQDRIDVEVLRAGMKRAVTLSLDKTKKDFLLIPGEQYDQNPRYFIFGGFVFSPLTKNFLNAWKHPPEELAAELSSWPTGDRKEIVIALMVLPDTVNRGYEKLNSWMIDTVNGRGFRDFDEFFELVTTSTEPYVIFKDKKGHEVIIDSREAEKSHRRILQTYSIRKDRSPDMVLKQARFSYELLNAS